VQERRAQPALTTARRTIRAIAVAVAAAVVIVDQLTKWWALNALDDRDIELVGSLRFHLVFNRGAAFGLGSRYAPLFALSALAVVMILFRSGGQFGRRGAQCAVGLVLGGAIGNLLDRLFRDGEGFLGGAVVDFIDVQFWPVWNVADMALLFGVVFLAVSVGREEAG
jgi:signal peptidase II